MLSASDPSTKFSVQLYTSIKMRIFWPFNLSRLPKYSNLDTEPFPDTESSEKNPVENQNHHGRFPPVYTQIALIVLAFICVLEASALVLQHYLWTSELRPLIKSPVPSGKRRFASNPMASTNPALQS